MEHIVTTGKIIGKTDRGWQREKILDIFCHGMEGCQYTNDYMQLEIAGCGEISSPRIVGQAINDYDYDNVSN